MNVLYFNLSVDKNDSPLAFGIDWIENFSKSAERVDVLTFRQGEYELPSNVTVYSISRSSRFKVVSRLFTVFSFYSVLWRLLRSFKYDLCFSHMNIMFINLAAPLCRLYDVPIKLWYAHPSRSLKLRVALLMVHKIVTSFPGAFPFNSSKVCEIGTGITLDLFEPGPAIIPSYDLLYCGRVSRSKNIDDLVSAVFDVQTKYGKRLSVLIVGPTDNTDADKTYTEELIHHIKLLKLERQFTFYGAANRYELAECYRSAKVHINLTYAGFGDKVVLESMYCTTPTVFRNVGMQSLALDYRNIFMFDAKSELASTLLNVLQIKEDKMHDIMSKIRLNIRENHNISTIADRVIDA